MLCKPTNVAVIRPASYGIRNARGYLLYWENEASTYQAIDSWHIYTTTAEAATAAAQKNPDARVVEVGVASPPPENAAEIPQSE